MCLRRVEAPTETALHAVERCPDCETALRDVHATKEKHPHDAGVQRRAKRLKALSLAAQAVAGAGGPSAEVSTGDERVWRRRQRCNFEQALARSLRRCSSASAGVRQV